MTTTALVPAFEQLSPQGHLRHFLTISGLPKAILTQILDLADHLVAQNAHTQKKLATLQNKTVFNLFFENSTRTRTTFELAAKRLGADVVSLNMATSSTEKGETLLDTVRNLQAMSNDIFVIRHPHSGTAHLLAQHVKPAVAVINAGDGRHAHPTQAMLDLFTIRRYKRDFAALSVAIVGDIVHSRVARSTMSALLTLGVGEVRLIAPKTLLPKHFITDKRVAIYHDMRNGLQAVDVIMMLRLQRERMQSAYIPSEREFHLCYGLTKETLAYAKPDVLVMHPGPTNRGIEIDAAIADGPSSVILEQVTYGIAVRMAVMMMVVAAREQT